MQTRSRLPKPQAIILVKPFSHEYHLQHEYLLRIENFRVKEWPQANHGSFRQGDSYIVLNTTEDPECGKLLHGIHFRLGQGSTADEMGMAEYKAVELDDVLDGEPIQHL